MKSLIFTILISSFFSTAFAESNTANFCNDYLKDQKRISEVKKNGWVKGTFKKEYLYGCLDLKWKDQLYQTLCLKQKSKIDLPKAIMFYFDGFGNFMPYQVKKEFNAINVTGKEPAGSIPSGVRFLSYLMSETMDEIYNRERYHHPDMPVEKEFNWDKDMQFHYHSGSGTDKIQGIENAEVCYVNMLNDLKIIEEKYPEISQPKKIILGYSNGGDSAIKFINNFTENHDAYFDLFMTLDPVPKAGGFIKNKITFSETTFKLNKKENINYSINLYQKTNEAVIGGIIGIVGSRVEGVDKEQELYYNHTYILMNSTVIETFSESIASLFADPVPLSRVDTGEK